jgi:uncharacterized protein DUF2341
MRGHVLVVATAMVAACGFRPTLSSGDDAQSFRDAPPPLDAAPADWWDPTFRWRIPLTITNGSTAALGDGFQVGLHFDLDAEPCTGPRDNIRIVYGNTTEVARVVDEVGTLEWTWFRLQVALAAGATSSEYWLYCGNPSPTPALADPTVVFEFFDDFLGTTLGPAWMKQSSVSVGGGVVTLGGVGLLDSGILTIKTWPAGTAVDYTVSIATPSGSDFWAGFQNGFPDMQPWIQWWSETAGDFRPDYASGPTDTAQFLGTNVPLDTAMHLWGVEYYGHVAMYRFDDNVAERHVHATSANPPALNFRLHNHSATTPVEYGMARVRKAADPPPTVTAGAAETY